MSEATTFLTGDTRALLATLAPGSVQTVITSPPYWKLRDYGVAGQIGLEPTLAEYVATMVDVFRAVRRVLAPDGTLWLNIGDGYSNAGQSGNDRRAGQTTGGKGHYTPCEGLGPKQLLGIPWRVAFALQADGWILRSDIVWHKPNVTPQPVKDRPTTSHEYLFLLSLQPDYYYDVDAIRETTGHEMSLEEYAARTAPGATWGTGGITRHAGSHKRDGGQSHPLGRNKRDVWTVLPERPDWEYCLACGTLFYGPARRHILVASQPDGTLIQTCPTCHATDAWVDHFAAFPAALIEPCIKAGSRPGDTVLDPFSGTGTTALTAAKWGRRGLGCELNPAYVALSRALCAVYQPRLLLEDVA